VVRESVHKHDYGHKQATATASVVAGDFEARDRRSDVGAGLVGVGGGVARRYDVNANQVFAWRRRYRGASAEPAELRLLPVTVMPDQPVGTAPVGASELIEIVFAGYRLRDGDGVKRLASALVVEIRR
jgi:hypothetical protein